MGIVGRLAVSCLALSLLGACSSDLGTAARPRDQRGQPARYATPGTGFDPGVRLSEPVTALAVAGAAIPAPAGDLSVAFVAFTTRTRADDADGSGTALDRTEPPPADGNGADDVFVAAMVNVELFVDGQPQPAAFTQGLAPVFRDDRCMACHSFHYPGGFREVGHPGGLAKGSNEGCGVCHSDGATLEPGSTRPATIRWEAPDATQDIARLLGQTQDFRGKSDRQLYDLAVSKPQPSHFLSDDKILWALAHGRVPFRGRAPGGAVPIELSQWDGLVQAWAQGAFQFSTTRSVLDVVLASQSAAGGAAAAGASTAPSVAFEPNPDYQPNNPEAFPAGWAVVAFASTAGDLVAGASTSGSQVYRTRVAVRVTRDAANPINLVAEPATTILVSSAQGAAARGGNGDSFEPALSGSGDLIAFASRATDLVAGFVDGNGEDGSDVYLAQAPVVAGGGVATTLVSRSLSAADAGGDGSSRSPTLSFAGPPTTRVVAFDSEASDLIAGDGNARRDVFFTRVGGAPVPLRRASVDSNEVETTGVDSSAASVWVDGESGEVFVAFAASAGTLDLVAGSAGPTAYLYRSVGSPRVLRLGRPSAGAALQPKISPDGRRVFFLSDAADLDGLRADGNGLVDVFSLNLETLRQSNGADIGYLRHSLAVTGLDADGASAMPMVAGFVSPDRSLQSDLVLAFTTAATNLGRSPNSEVVLQFLIDRTRPRTVAAFSVRPRVGVASLTVQFTNLSINADTSQWDFGDNTTSGERDPQHTYLLPGRYRARLTVTGSGGSSTREDPDDIVVNRQPRTWTEIYEDGGAGGLNNGARCSGCHRGQSAREFDLRTRDAGYDALVGRPSQVCAGRTRVVPRDPDASVLLQVLNLSGCHATHTGGRGNDELLAALREWIEAGALR